MDDFHVFHKIPVDENAYSGTDEQTEAGIYIKPLGENVEPVRYQRNQKDNHQKSNEAFDFGFFLAKQYLSVGLGKFFFCGVIADHKKEFDDAVNNDQAEGGIEYSHTRRALQAMGDHSMIEDEYAKGDAAHQYGETRKNDEALPNGINALGDDFLDLVYVEPTAFFQLLVKQLPLFF